MLEFSRRNVMPEPSDFSRHEHNFPPYCATGSQLRNDRSGVAVFSAPGESAASAIQHLNLNSSPPIHYVAFPPPESLVLSVEPMTFASIRIKFGRSSRRINAR